MRGEIVVGITRPAFVHLTVRVRSISKLVQQRFSEEARRQFESKQRGGDKPEAHARPRRKARDFEREGRAGTYRGGSSNGWYGIPCNALRSGMIACCRLTSMKMVNARLAIFVEADGYDYADGTPLVRIATKAPKYLVSTVNGPNGRPDLRCRAHFEAWEATVRIRYDSEQLTETDVVNLLMRCGLQNGIGNGRPNSKKSDGQGWGMFEVVEDHR